MYTPEPAPVRIGRNPLDYIKRGIVFWLIMGGLAFLLWPVFNHSLLRTDDITCLSNAKYSSLALLMYKEDNDDLLPIAERWMDTNSPYIKSKEPYRCPKVQKSTPSGYGYAFNNRLSGKPWKQFKRPETMPMLYDSDDLRLNANAPGRTGLANPPRHGQVNNIGYLDGHAKAEVYKTDDSE